MYGNKFIKVNADVMRNLFEGRSGRRVFYSVIKDEYIMCLDLSARLA